MVKHLILISFFVTALGATPSAPAQSFPTKPVRIIVPFAAGGGTDLIARALAQKLAEGWGQPVVIDKAPAAAP